MEATYELVVAVGARVMCLVNLNVKKGLTNGSLGTVIACNPDIIECNFGGYTHDIRRYK